MSVLVRDKLSVLLPANEPVDGGVIAVVFVTVRRARSSSKLTQGRSLFLAWSVLLGQSSRRCTSVLVIPVSAKDRPPCALEAQRKYETYRA